MKILKLAMFGLCSSISLASFANTSDYCTTTRNIERCRFKPIIGVYEFSGIKFKVSSESYVSYEKNIKTGQFQSYQATLIPLEDVVIPVKNVNKNVVLSRRANSNLNVLKFSGENREMTISGTFGPGLILKNQLGELKIRNRDNFGNMNQIYINESRVIVEGTFDTFKTLVTINGQQAQVGNWLHFHDNGALRRASVTSDLVFKIGNSERFYPGYIGADLFFEANGNLSRRSYQYLSR